MELENRAGDRRLLHVRIDETGGIGPVPGQKPEQRRGKLLLRSGQTVQQGDEEPSVPLALSLHDGGRMRGR